MNKAFVIGCLGHTASVKTFAATLDREASVVVNFSLGVSVGFGDQRQTLWYGCAWWGRRAEKCAPYLTKGTRVAIVGEPGVRAYEKRDHSPGAEITLRVDELELLGGGREERADTEPRREEPASAASRNEEDVPF